MGAEGLVRRGQQEAPCGLQAECGHGRLATEADGATPASHMLLTLTVGQAPPTSGHPPVAVPLLGP